MTHGPPPDPWHRLRAITAARIGLGRAGTSLPTREVLAFGLAHAQARDAVHARLDVGRLADELTSRGLPTLLLRSAASDRREYLRRPDLGRRLDSDSAAQLDRWPGPSPDLSLVLADGLSANAVMAHGMALIDALLPLLGGWRTGPVVIAEQARVALGDPVGHGLGAGQVVVLIGERPGLSSPDSLGAYLTHAPRPGRTDAERNCLSNIRHDGLPPAVAAARLAHLIRGARALGRSGVDLKDDFPVPGPTPAALP